MAYANVDEKKFLNAHGLDYFIRKLNSYPQNNIIPDVINGFQTALTGKQDLIHADTTANWNAHLTFIPAKGEIVIYLDKKIVEEGNETVTYPGIKIGDGMAYCVDLPFLGDDIAAELLAHINNSSVHVSSADRMRWDSKLNCTVNQETLILDRN